YFRLSAREVAEMDPQQRLTLEVAHEALFDANINSQALNDRRVGVFVGAGMAEYLAMGFADPNTMTPHTMSGVSLGMIANRLSYLLNLEGPSLTVDTACSSSLTALYIACQALNSGDCDLALVAGVNALLGPSPFVGLSQAHMLSPRGTSLPFDADADGFVRGEGCGVIVLGRSDRPFQDLRRVYAEIIGCEANENGKTASLTIPSAARQTSLMRHALKRARIADSLTVAIDEVAKRWIGRKQGKQSGLSLRGGWPICSLAGMLELLLTVSWAESSSKIAHYLVLFRGAKQIDRTMQQASTPSHRGTPKLGGYEPARVGNAGGIILTR
ncbi:polyketide synthase, partial [Pseudomonas sp. Q1]|uniref:beta-ketoacyl [acyl carrier protein] synthase domain-containing protein n=1 Tax=Pseudomonas sp. Q1 TaxID=2202823 RepID=UPI00137511E5